jgi:magnesium transporter
MPYPVLNQEKSMPDSTFYLVTRAGKLVSMPSPAGAVEAARKGGTVWLHYTRPNKEALSELVELLDLHPLSIEDCLDENQIPKIEDYPKHSFILFNAFSYTEKKLSISEFDMFIGDNFLVTVAESKHGDPPIFKNPEHIVELDIANAAMGPAFLGHVLLDYIVDQKFMAIEALEEEINTTEDLILTSDSKFSPGDLLKLRRDVLSLRKSLFHEREILVKVCRKDCRYIPEKAIFFYRDIYDHLAKFFELTESSRDIVTSLMEMYLSMLNNQMAKSANDMNSTVRRLTFITTIFMPLTLLAGIGGMSEWSMMTGPDNWKVSYPVFLVSMVVLGVVNYYFLKWIEKRRGKSDYR